MNIRRITALSASLLLSLSAVSLASAHPWRVLQLPSNGAHSPAPEPALPTHVHGNSPTGGAYRRPVPAPAPAPAAPPHANAPTGGGFWHTVPVAPSGGSHFAGGGGRWHGDRDDDWDRHRWHHDWGHGDIRFFVDDDDWFAWRSGYWYNGWYGPRFGWWWVVSGVWFFYPAPVYPYPDPYVPSDWAAPPPPPPAVATTPATVSYWYFCPASNGYYPYVPSCPTGWQQVPAQPQAAPSAATTVPPPPPDGPPGG